jgi:hypothetical protein
MQKTEKLYRIYTHIEHDLLDITAHTNCTTLHSYSDASTRHEAHGTRERCGSIFHTCARKAYHRTSRRIKPPKITARCSAVSSEACIGINRKRTNINILPPSPRKRSRRPRLVVLWRSACRRLAISSHVAVCRVMSGATISPQWSVRPVLVSVFAACCLPARVLSWRRASSQSDSRQRLEPERAESSNSNPPGSAKSIGPDYTNSSPKNIRV